MKKLKNHKEDNSYWIIFSALRFTVHAQLEIALASHLTNALNNAKLLVILCDGSPLMLETSCIKYSDCELHDHARSKHGDNIKSSDICAQCKYSSKQYLHHFLDDLEILTVGELLQESAYQKMILDASWKRRRIMYKTIFPDNEKHNLIDQQILSSLFTRHRVSTVKELAGLLKNGDELRKVLDSAVKFFLLGFYVGERLKETRGIPKLCMAFNGRFNPTSGLKQSFFNSNIPIIFHERGYQKGSFSLSVNYDPGNPFASYKDWINPNKELDNKLLPVTRQQQDQLKTYFHQRRGQINVNGFLFTGLSQNHKSKGARLDFNKQIEPYILIFTSSSDEISGYNEYATYGHQLELIHNLSALSIRLGCRVVVRQHPNLGTIGRKTPATQFLDDVKYIEKTNKLLTIIDPDNPINSYDLAFSAAYIFAPQSSIYLELVYWGLPVLQIKESPYSDLVQVPIYLNKIYSATMEDLRKWTIQQKTNRDLISQVSALHFIGASQKIEGCEIKNGFYPHLLYDKAKKSEYNSCLAKQIVSSCMSGRIGYFLNTKLVEMNLESNDNID